MNEEIKEAKQLAKRIKSIRKKIIYYKSKIKLLEAAKVSLSSQAKKIELRIKSNIE
tara:strand:- start:1312 stop:1479 length:168 start_codon:yes stop_codon:yes gene_type:complete